MHPESEKTQNRPHHWSLLVPIALIIGLAVLGALSLRQHRALERLRRISRDDAQKQIEQTYLLVNQLSHLQREFDRQIAGNLQNNSSTLPTPGPQMADSLNQLAADVKALHRQINQLSRETVPTALTDQLTQLSLQIDQSQQQVDQVMTQSRWSERIVAELSGGVCLIQGEYIFVDPTTDRPLRYSEETPKDTISPSPAAIGAAESEPEEAYPVSIYGKGETLTVQYTGTGFLISAQGYILTNEHVTAPWEISPDYKHVLAAGYQPRLRLFRAFFPSQPDPFDLRVVSCSQEKDVAMLHANLEGADLPVLPCETSPQSLKVGQTVIVLGYPTGFDVLLARMSEDELTEIVGPDGASFEKMALNMAARRLIAPVATRGMCGRVSAGKIVYDAQTAIGGSGAPVLAQNGKVVAINTALLKGFAGSNFGIPVASGLELLTAADTHPVDIAQQSATIITR